MKKDNENEVNVLDELNKGACMGMDAIHFILDKVEDDKFKKILEEQYKQYEVISNKIEKLYPEYEDDKEPHETNKITKARPGMELK